MFQGFKNTQSMFLRWGFSSWMYPLSPPLVDFSQQII